MDKNGSDGIVTHERLEGSSGNEKGGLIVTKKANPDVVSDDHLFKKPSMLGLEKLAKLKREENLRKRKEEEETPGISESVRNRINE